MDQAAQAFADRQLILKAALEILPQMRHICLMIRIRPTTYDAILEAGFHVLGGNPGASMADVANAAGVGRATLHRHFRTREDLMSVLAIAAMKDLSEAADAATAEAESYTEALRLALEAVIPLANRQVFLTLEAAARDPAVAAAYEKDRTETFNAFEQAKAEGSFAKDIPTEWLFQSYDALTYAAWEMVSSGEATPKQAAAFAWRTLTSGLSGATNDT